MNVQALDRLMRNLAEQQQGVVGREQLRERGVCRQAVAARLRSPDWTAVTPRVLRLVGIPANDKQRAMSAVLDSGAGAVLSHRSAAAAWGLPGFNLAELELSRQRTGANRGTTLARLHHPCHLPPHHCTIHRGLPVTTLVRTVFDLAGSEHAGRAERALHAALRAGLRWSTIEDHLHELARQGRPGIELMRLLVATHSGRPALGSGLEARFLRILLDAGLPQPRRQVDLGRHSWVGRVDFLYDDVRLVIEVNGAWTHSTSMDVERDQYRTARLVAAGYTVLPVSEHLVLGAPEEVVRLVRSARRRAADAAPAFS